MLPHYSEPMGSGSDLSVTQAQNCPCMVKKRSMRTRGAEGRNPELESLFEQNVRFERLVSGQESEVGQSPPAYDSLSTA